MEELCRADEAQLLARARRGDADAFGALIGPYERRTFNLALRLVGDRDLAADLTQDALLRAFAGVARFRGEARFGTWLFRIVHNQCLDALRWRARHPEALVDGQHSPEAGATALSAPSAAGPEETVLRHERHAALLEALARLEPEFRAAVVLRDVQGLPYEEVAAIVAVPLGTLKSRLHRARSRLRELLADTVVFQSGGER